MNLKLDRLKSIGPNRIELRRNDFMIMNSNTAVKLIKYGINISNLLDNHDSFYNYFEYRRCDFNPAVRESTIFPKVDKGLDYDINELTQYIISEVDILKKDGADSLSDLGLYIDMYCINKLPCLSEVHVNVFVCIYYITVYLNSNYSNIQELEKFLSEFKMCYFTPEEVIISNSSKSADYKIKLWDIENFDTYIKILNTISKFCKPRYCNIANKIPEHLKPKTQEECDLFVEFIIKTGFVKNIFDAYSVLDNLGVKFELLPKDVDS